MKNKCENWKNNYLTIKTIKTTIIKQYENSDNNDNVLRKNEIRTKSEERKQNNESVAGTLQLRTVLHDLRQ